MYQNYTYVISYFKNLANLNFKFHTTKTILNSTIISSHPSNMGPSKKGKTSIVTKAIINKGHNGCTDINVDGNITTCACVIDRAAIGGTNATGNCTIEVDVANTTNVAAAGEAIAATMAAAGNAIAAPPRLLPTTQSQSQWLPLTMPLQPQYMPLMTPLKPPWPLLATQPTKRTPPMQWPSQTQMPLAILPSRLTSRTPQTQPPLLIPSQPMQMPLAMVSRSPVAWSPQRLQTLKTLMSVLWSE
jgi:hypothetical protein